MAPQRNTCITINGQHQSVVDNFRLPEGWCDRYPMIGAMIFFHQAHPDLELSAYQYDKDFNLHFLWQGLLEQGQLPPIYNFPPYDLVDFGTTLELQAGRMLIAACRASGLAIRVIFNQQSAQPDGYTVRLLMDVFDEFFEIDSQYFTVVRDLVRLSDANDLSPEVATFTSGKQLPRCADESRSLFAFWTEDQQYFENLPEHQSLKGDALICALWNWRNHRVWASPRLTAEQDGLALHYLHTIVSLSDEVICDRQFLGRYHGSVDELWSELIDITAHIRCTLPYPSNKLDALIVRCQQPALHHWRAYLLAHGHVLRAYRLTGDSATGGNSFLAGYRLYKSLGDFFGITRVFHARASFYSKNADYRRALKLLNSCQIIRTLLQDDHGVAKVLNGMAYIHALSDNLYRTLECHLRAETKLERCEQFDELAFTYSQISWTHFLQSNYQLAIEYGLKTLATMSQHHLHTLAFRTRPDIHAQLGLIYFFNEQYDQASAQSDQCEANLVGSSSTGEVMRTLLRGLINEQRGYHHLSVTSFQYIPDLLLENNQLDPHLEALYYRILLQSAQTDDGHATIRNLTQKARDYCVEHGLLTTLNWFH